MTIRLRILRRIRLLLRWTVLLVVRLPVRLAPLLLGGILTSCFLISDFTFI